MKSNAAQATRNFRRASSLSVRVLNAGFSLIVLTYSAFGGPRFSANYAITAEIMDAGGRSGASANYANVASAAVVAGVSNVAAPVQTAKAGYIGQLYDIAGLIVNSSQPTLDEGTSLQLAAWQSLDDASFLAVNSLSVTWGAAVPPIAAIGPDGLATAGIVFQDTPAVIEGMFGGFSDTLDLTVLNVNADDFGLYAGDGVGDDWQVRFFGFDNPEAAPGLDPDGDGGTNVFEFTAGLIPTDPNSVFRLRLEAVPGQPNHRNIIFSPRLDGRTYVVETSPALDEANWEPLGAHIETDNGDERTVTDLEAAGVKFYRIEINKP